MKLQIHKLNIIIVALLGFALVSANCNLFNTKSEEDAMSTRVIKNSDTNKSDGHYYAVQDGGQLITDGDNLRIGVGNIRPNSVEDQRLTVGLWLFFPDQSKDQQHRVFKDETIEVEGYSVYVADIVVEDEMVILQIKYPIPLTPNVLDISD